MSTTTGTKKKSTGLTLDDLRKKKKPNMQEMWVAGDSLAADRLREAQEEYERCQRVVNIRKNPEDLMALDAAKLAVASIKEEIMPTMIHFVFKALSSHDYDEMVGEHTWTEPQKKEWQKRNPGLTDEQLENMPAWNPDTFPKALIASSVVEPPLSQGEMLEWLDDPEWNSAELMGLFQAAMEVNNSRRVVDLGKG